MLNLAKNSKFQRISMFPENIWKNSRKMWKFDILSAKSISVTKIKWKWCPIHWNWPNIANSGKFPDFQKISRKFPEKKSRKLWNLIFWVQNQFQWLKSSGNDAPYIEIGEKKQIPENFQISRIFLEKIQKNGKFEILSSKSSSVT